MIDVQLGKAKKMKICVITLRYPTIKEPTALTFVQQLVWQMADEGQDVCVICPLPINKIVQYKYIPEKTDEQTPMGKTVTVYHPRSFYLGQINIGKWNTAYLSTLLFKNAVDRVLSQMVEKPDVLYGHFVTPAGIVAAVLGAKYKIPSFLAYGESSTWSIDHVGKKKVKKLLANLNGVVSVSTANKDEIVGTGVVEATKVTVFPNGYSSSRFYQKDKNESRRRFNLPQDKFIVAFVGHFIERKGINVLVQAINQIPEVYLICAGKGPLNPKGDKILFSGIVNPDDLASFYSSADCFVLPTVNEGCCNAIIEAMACGLPIISSNQSFNDDILDENNSLRIDSRSVEDVKQAIEKIFADKELRCKMARASLVKARSLNVAERAKNIIKYFMETEQQDEAVNKSSNQ